MLKLFSKLAGFLKLGPILAETIQKSEELFPESGQGKVKLDLIKLSVINFFTVAGDAFGKFEELWPTIEKWIADIVKMFNTLGIFKGKT